MDQCRRSRFGALRVQDSEWVRPITQRRQRFSDCCGRCKLARSCVSSSGKFFKHFRLRHGLSQARMAALVRVTGRRLAAWENGESEPGSVYQSRVMDVVRDLPSELLAGLSQSVVRCELPRALCKSGRLNLQAVSGPAIDKRPSIVDWIGRDLVPVACGVLASMLDDRELQRAIVKREVAGVVATTQSVLRTNDAGTVGTYRTTINYFFHDNVLYSDAVALPVSPDERSGYTPIMMDEIGADLFGDHDALEAALAATRASAPRVRVGPA